METTGLTAGEFEDILCDACRDVPLTYYCPACDFKVCVDCLEKHFRRRRSGALECRKCGNVDRKLSTFVGTGRL
ncbi:MAG: B-box zinc finger protein [bacterium]